MLFWANYCEFLSMGSCGCLAGETNISNFREYNKDTNFLFQPVQKEDFQAITFTVNLKGRHTQTSRFNPAAGGRKGQVSLSVFIEKQVWRIGVKDPPANYQSIFE